MNFETVVIQTFDIPLSCLSICRIALINVVHGMSAAER